MRMAASLSGYGVATSVDLHNKADCPGQERIIPPADASVNCQERKCADLRRCDRRCAVSARDGAHLAARILQGCALSTAFGCFLGRNEDAENVSLVVAESV